MKRCSKCHEFKELTYFSKCSQNKDGLKCTCKICLGVSNRKRYTRDKDKILARHREAYHKNIDKSRKQSLESYYRHHSERKKSSADNARKYWREKSPEEKLIQGRKYRKNLIKYKKNNPGKSAYYLALRRATKHNATPPWVDKTHKKIILGFYKQAQQLTKDTGVKHEVDHIEPLCGKISNGLHVHWNLQVIPALHNRIKNNKLN